jgi:predicted XRE-type DNA-binding protein
MIKTQSEARELIKQYFLKQEDVANELGIEKTYFNKWVKGHIIIGAVKFDRIVTWIQNKK